MSIEDVQVLLGALSEKKRQLEAKDARLRLDVLVYFLEMAKARKANEIAQMQSELALLTEDLNSANARLRLLSLKRTPNGDCSSEQDAQRALPNRTCHYPDVSDHKRRRTSTQYPTHHRGLPLDVVGELASSYAINDGVLSPLAISNVQGEPLGLPHRSPFSDVSGSPRNRAGLLDATKRRMHDYYEGLEECYLQSRVNDAHHSDSDGLKRFSTALWDFIRYSSFNHLATIQHGDIYNQSSIVSAIEFDRDGEFFATAGVSKKIKLFDYEQVIAESRTVQSSSGFGDRRHVMKAAVHCPVREMVCRSKISCLSWNTYVKSQIASTDYEGVVSVWDAFRGSVVMTFDEHSKRAWSVDFSTADPTRLASGSDDSKVKIWSTAQKSSVATIESKANVCCVRFNPANPHHIAFGSADHNVHLYDLRHPRAPYAVLSGHRKAVSYVTFMDRHELVSASTDSTLRLWSTAGVPQCTRTFTGHKNERNFVGLAVKGDWLSCGSENNSIFVYYKSVSDSAASLKFASASQITGETGVAYDEGGTQQFVSSVCWKPNSSVLLAANSQGTVKVVELV